MPAKQRLEHQQKLIFSQSLQQSLRVLELSLLELKDAVDKEIVENPAVEEIQDKNSSESIPEQSVTVKVEYSDEDDASPSGKEVVPGELANYEKPIPGRKETLIDVLSRQLRISAKDDRQIKTGLHLLEQMDENGYIRQSIDELCAGTDFLEEEARETLKLIQTFEPFGVGARDLKECLLIQLKRKKETDPLTVKIIEDHFQGLEKLSPEKLSMKLKCSKEELKNALKKIRSLEPKPGRSYSIDETVYIIPDITIEQKDNVLQVITKDDNIPVIRVNPVYRNMLKSDKVDEQTKNFIREKIRNATSLISAIQQRKETLARVVSIIAETQKDSLIEGIEKLKPLTLKEVAQECGLHESTVSRVVMNKYVQTPAGVFPLRKFFSTAIKNSEGENVSSSSVKAKIKELIDSEDKKAPLRDQKIAEVLENTEKIRISRRTVAKYRENLKIPPVSQRRRNI